MDTMWFESHVEDNVAIIRCGKGSHPAWPADEDDSACWATDLEDLVEELACYDVVLDCGAMEYMTLRVFNALRMLDKGLRTYGGSFCLRGVRQHVLLTLQVLAPQLDAIANPFIFSTGRQRMAA